MLNSEAAVICFPPSNQRDILYSDMQKWHKYHVRSMLSCSMQRIRALITLVRDGLLIPRAAV
jgi:hypothetical protein